MRGVKAKASLSMKLLDAFAFFIAWQPGGPLSTIIVVSQNLFLSNIPPGSPIL